MPLAGDGLAAVIFDLDDTLVNWREAERKAIQDLAARLAEKGAEPARVVETYAGIMAENFISFRATRSWMYIGDRLALLLQRLGIEGTDLGKVTQAFTEEARGHLRLLDGADEVLTAVGSRGLRSALLTNGPPSVQRPKVERFGLGSRLDAVAISGETGYWKPDPEAFLNALRILGAAPGATLMVGDSLEFDIRPAKALGLRTCWVDPMGASDPAADLVVRTPRGLLAHLARQNA